jgi:hypothetical protein
LPKKIGYIDTSLANLDHTQISPIAEENTDSNPTDPLSKQTFQSFNQKSKSSDQNVSNLPKIAHKKAENGNFVGSKRNRVIEG